MTTATVLRSPAQPDSLVDIVRALGAGDKGLRESRELAPACNRRSVWPRIPHDDRERPDAVPGVGFPSVGQSHDLACTRLDTKISVALGQPSRPIDAIFWRAIEEPAPTWRGQDAEEWGDPHARLQRSQPNRDTHRGNEAPDNAASASVPREEGTT